MTKKTAAPKAKAPALKRTPVAAAVAQTAAPDVAGEEAVIEVPGAPLPPVLGGDLLEPPTDEELAKAVEALPNTAPRLTAEHIQRVIADEIYTRIEGTLTTVCTLKLRNGYTVVGVNNGPVSPENFDQQVACEYAYKAAVNQIWPLEGYLLKEFLADAKAKSELNPVFELAKAAHAVVNAYHASQGLPTTEAWPDLADEQQMAVVDHVAAILNSTEPPDVRAVGSVEDMLVSALVNVLKAGRHG